MEFEKFLDDTAFFCDNRKMKIEQIKNHNLPVIIFGANWMARHIKNLLSDFNVKVAGFAVDAEYFEPNQKFMSLPIFNFAELSLQADKYIFILGMNSDWIGKNRSWEFVQDKKIIHYELLDGGYDTADKNFILENKAAFAEIFNILEDEFSRKTLVSYLKAMITWEPTELYKVFSPNVYFNELTNGVRTPNRGGVC